MAVKTIQTLIDDLDPTVGADETVTFALDGVNYAIDLTQEHASEMRDLLAPYVSAGRRVGGRRRTGRSAAASSTGEHDTQVVRQWLRDHGYSVNDKGRIAKEYLAAYEAATQ